MSLAVSTLDIPLNAVFVILILRFISWSDFKSDVIKLPRYLNFSTCLIFIPSISNLYIGLQIFFEMVMHMVFLLLISKPNFLLSSAITVIRFLPSLWNNNEHTGPSLRICIWGTTFERKLFIHK